MNKKFNRYLRNLRKRKLRREVFKNKRILMLMAIFLNDLTSSPPEDFKLNEYLKIKEVYSTSKFLSLVRNCRKHIVDTALDELVEKIDNMRGYNKIGKSIRSI